MIDRTQIIYDGYDLHRCKIIMIGGVCIPLECFPLYSGFYSRYRQVFPFFNGMINRTQIIYDELCIKKIIPICGISVPFKRSNYKS